MHHVSSTPTVAARRRPRPAAALAVPLFCLLALAGCAHADLASDVASLGSPSDTSPTGTTPSGSTDPEQAARDFAACMRDHGVDMPDPQFKGDGTSKMIIGGGDGAAKVGGAPDEQKLEAADKACRHLMDGVAQDAQRKMDPAELEKMKQQALDFSKCMREHGVDMPDPTFEDGGGGFRASIGKGDGPKLDPASPAFQDAQKACAQYQPQGAGQTTSGGGAEGGPSAQVSPADGSDQGSGQ